jgi:ATP-dependent phosphoenolpyruvate carboxykinase
MKRTTRLMGVAPLVLLAGPSQAVHMFKGFTSKVDLERAGITDKKGTFS